MFYITPLGIGCQLNAPHFIQIQPVPAQETHSSVCL